MKLVRLMAVSKKELLQLRRDRLTVGMIIGIPMMQMMLFGYAINTDIRNVPTLVADHDQSAASRDVVRRMEASKTFEVRGHAHTHGEIERAFRRREASAAIVIPRGFGGDMTSGKPTQLQLVIDGSDPQTVGGATSSAAMLTTRVGLMQAAENAARLGRAAVLPQAELATDVLYNPEQRTAVFVVPGLIGVILTMTMVLFTSMAIAREGERGTLEQLIVSPVTRFELMAGKLLPYVAIGYVQISIVLAVGRFMFGVPIVGSLWLLYGLAFAFIAANLSVGLVFSTIAKNQQQAMQLSFFFLLPNILMSGFAFPWEGMPAPAQWLSQMLPLTHFLRIVRTIVLKGGGFADVEFEFLWMCGILAVLLLVATLRFRKQLA